MLSRSESNVLAEYKSKKIQIQAILYCLICINGPEKKKFNSRGPTFSYTVMMFMRLMFDYILYVLKNDPPGPRRAHVFIPLCY